MCEGNVSDVKGGVKALCEVDKKGTPYASGAGGKPNLATAAVDGHKSVA